MATKEAKAQDAGISLISGRTDYRTPCPACSPNRRKKRDPCLHITVTASEIHYFCHHCQDFKGTLTDDLDRRDAPNARGPWDRRGAGRPPGLRQYAARGW